MIRGFLSSLLVAAATTIALAAISVSGAGVLHDLYAFDDLLLGDGNNDDGTAAYDYLRLDSVAALDGDQNIVLARLALESTGGMLAAQRVFEKGARSEPFAVFDFAGDPSFANLNVPPGTLVAGKSADGHGIRGVTRYGSPAGNSTVTVHYPPEGTDPGDFVDVVTGTLEELNDGGAKCRVGGNPTPDTTGCYAPSGTLEIHYDPPAGVLSVGYEYDAYDPLYSNANGLSLATLWGDRTKPKTTLQKYLNYYGSADYDTQWIRAAFAGTKTPNFVNDMNRNTDMDFSALTIEGRHSAIRWGMVALKVWVFVLESLEEASALCRDGSSDNGAAVRVWDRAVGAFAGSGPIAETPTNKDDGYFVYNMIQAECVGFGTCGIGIMAPLNAEILSGMSSGRASLLVGGCRSVRSRAERLASLLVIPLVQGVIRNAYALDRQDNSLMWVQGQVAAYAASIAPLLHGCSAGNAFVVIDDLAAGNATGASFEVVKDALERSYGCLGISCDDVDGLRAVNNNDEYESGAEPCGRGGGPATATGSSYTDVDDGSSYTDVDAGSSYTDVDASESVPTPALPSVPTPALYPTKSPATAPGGNGGTKSGSGGGGGRGSKVVAKYGNGLELTKSDSLVIGITIGATLLAAILAIGYCRWDRAGTARWAAAAAAAAEEEAAAAEEAAVVVPALSPDVPALSPDNGDVFYDVSTAPGPAPATDDDARIV